MNNTILLLIPVLPALGALINGVRAAANPKTHKNRTITNAVALGSTGLSALLAAWTVITYVSGGMSSAFQHAYYTWIPRGLGHVGANGIANFAVDFAFRIDTLSCTMLLIVTWIGFLIHVYATGYMAHEEGYTRFFTYLNLFMFMMLLLVLGANYMVMFVGWEGVGLCSYLLIGFYYDKNFAADAGKKAFVANRIGDFGFILGIFLIFNTFGTADYGKVFALASANPAAYAGIATDHLPAALRRRLRQVRADSAVRLAARRHGRTDAGLRADPRRDDGHRRRLHGGALERPLPAVARRRCWSSRSSARSRRSSRRRSASRRTTSRKCSPTRPSRSSASCSSPPASARSPRRSSTS